MPRYKKKSKLTLYLKGQRKRKYSQSPVKTSPFKATKRQCKIKSPLNTVQLILSPSRQHQNRTSLKNSPMAIQILQSPSYKSIPKMKLQFEHQTINNGIEEIEEIEKTTDLLKNLVKDGAFRTSNIAFKLLQDTLNWYSCGNTSGMRYSNEVKDFFWTGRRLLGGQFLRFMRGFAHKGMVAQGSISKGIYDPLQTEINFPVPSERALDDYQPSGIAFSSTLEPGIIKQNIDLYANAYQDVSCVVMFDGKKIVPNSADVYLLHQEEEPKLADIKSQYENKCRRIENLVDTLEDLNEQGQMYLNQISQNDKDVILEDCKSILEDIGLVTKSLRQTYAKKKIYLNTLEKKFTETNDGKYKYAVNKIRTFQYQISICVKDLLQVVNDILQCCALLNHREHLFQNSICSLNCQENYRELKPPTEVKISCGISPEESLPTHLLKQRTPEWFDLRKTVKVTGSVMHKAIGLDTLIAQREHFDTVIGGKEPPEFSSAQKEAMSHGSENELNAVATFVCKVMPTYFPDYTFYEEGAYVIKNKQKRDIVIVSPDGSLRNQNEGATISIEIKCPYSAYAGSTPVYYDMKYRHVLQNLSESHVLNSEEHIYISWSKESTTVFKMTKNDELFQKALKQVTDVFYEDLPRRPTKISQTVKEIKSHIQNETLKAKYLCEVPSVIAKLDTDKRDSINSPYYQPMKESIDNMTDTHLLTDIIQSLHKAKKLTMDAFNFQKPVSSEVLVHLISDMDRTWKREVGHGLPISYLFKGYSLTMATSRRILKEVLKACITSDIHVPCVSFDGQFAPLKDFDDNNNPMTLFVFQRQFWSKVRKLSKRELVVAVCNLFTESRITRQKQTIFDEEDNIAIRAGSYCVQNKNTDIKPIVSQIDVIHKKTVLQSETITQPEPTDCSGLEETVVHILEGIVNNEENNATVPDEILSNEPLRNVEDVEQHKLESDVNQGTEENKSAEALLLQDNDYEILYKLLCSSKRSQKWTQVTLQYLKTIFESAELMNKEFTGQELHEIVKYINIKLTKDKKTIKQNLRKAEKINCLCASLGHSCILKYELKIRRSKKVKTLKALCLSELQKRTYPKDAIAVAYAKSCWLAEERTWYESTNTFVSKEVKINKYLNNSLPDMDDNIKFTPIYSPQYNDKSKHLEVRIMDGTHIRTNIKSKLIRSNLENVKLSAWKTVAISGKTDLAPAMLEVHNDGKIIHQQSDPYVRTMFSEEVEEQLKQNGRFNEAKFCNVFREWHDAEDKAGIGAFDRCSRSLMLRDWLLEGYNFDQFPPKSQYVKGIPRVTFEGLICSIDAHLLLYGIVKNGTYNWRSVSTLVAENFMGELAERSQNNYGVPSGNSLPADMRKISELHAMRLKPNRSFQMKTAKSRSYPVPTGLKGCSEFEMDGPTNGPSNSEYTDLGDSENDVLPESELKISQLTVRDHEFDIRKSGKRKMGILRKFGEQPRGVQSVRTHYKVDESKILPSLSLGLTDEMILSPRK